MNKEEILNFIKKNVLSLTCGFVALLALGATFYPLGGMVTELQTQAESHAGDYNTLAAFSKARKLPVSDPNKTDWGTLASFPTPADIVAGENSNKLWASYSKQVFDSLQQLNQNGHSLLVADALPQPHLDSTYFTFGRLYKLVLTTDSEISATGDSTATPPVPADPSLIQYHQLNLQNDILHGGLPPSIDEIKNSSAMLWENVYKPQVVAVNGNPVNMPELQERFNEEVSQLPHKMKGDAAKKHRIYVEKDAFTVSTTIRADSQPQLTDMWYAQMQLWVQQDLSTAIAQENSSSKNVLDAPVKRLLTMYIPPPPMYVFPPAIPGGTSTGGVPAAAKETDPIPPVYSISVSGRYSNGMYDVIPFRLVIDVDATKVNEIIESLRRSQLISITGENEFALSSEAESDRGYLYGPGATVRLQLDGEILFLRSWTMPLMPMRVQQALGLIPGATPGNIPQPNGPGPGGMMGFPGGGPPGMPPR